MKNGNALRAKNMMYVQQLAYLPMKTIENLIELAEKKLGAQKYAVILHDKDIDKNGLPEDPHIQMMMSFENARYVKSIAKELGDKPEYLEVWKGDSRNGYAYLIHATTEARHKHQYSVDEVKANFDYPAMIQKMTQEVKSRETYRDSAKINMILDLVYSGEMTKDEAAEQLSGQQYAKASKSIDIVFNRHLEVQAEKWREEMIREGKCVKVIWICGNAGTGKTRLAKAYAEKKGQPYYVSGSSRDIFQNYKGEHILILDELRPRNIPYHDLLRILDPFSVQWQTMAPSRYTDKALAVELIIVTSPFDPKNFYEVEFGGRTKAKEIDRFEQLERRIALVIKMEQKEIYTETFNTWQDRYIKKASTIRPNTYSNAGSPQPAADADTIYNDMLQ